MIAIIADQSLAQLEAMIERGVKHALDAGKALRIIQEQQLYYPEYKNFEDYIEKRWSYCRTYIYRLKQVSEVDRLGAPITNISQALALHHVSEELQPMVADFLQFIPDKITAKNITILAEAIETAINTGTFDGEIDFRNLDAHLVEEIYERKQRLMVRLNSKQPILAFSGSIDEIINYLLKNAQNTLFEVLVYEKTIVLRKTDINSPS